MIIKSAQYVKSSAVLAQCPEHRLTEYAFIGRSNVGKSSLINMLTGHNKLAKTSATPGKTMLINHFIINNEWYLVDLPGYGFANRGKKERAKLEQMIAGYILQRDHLTNLFVLIDCRHAPQQIDLEFINWLGESNVPFSIVFTKADKLSRQKLNENIAAYMKHLSQDWDPLPPYFVTSSENRTGHDELLDYIENINKDHQNQ